jgi:hypothetical protein
LYNEERSYATDCKYGNNNQDKSGFAGFFSDSRDGRGWFGGVCGWGLGRSGSISGRVCDDWSFWSGSCWCSFWGWFGGGLFYASGNRRKGSILKRRWRNGSWFSLYWRSDGVGRKSNGFWSGSHIDNGS